ncbi:protoporphyrinogen/coproporphyrinogen oxidase [Pedobacter duraquae]|uniref:Protoporphyrinogen oxidase n=1 Tax=Pedobacter duraquae TaxID=425511 RepID=A0A4R6IBP1_9SPHI|nr:NAD(P)-binding protein [Pedobacter duraquae]TDO19016.1 protoporphyrinogen oxidase [Pedobacter duraquae]
MKKALVIGSGISGLSVSRMLSPDFEVEILEKSDKIGGLIKCERIDGNLFHRVGGHVFNSRNTAVLDWFWKHFDQEHEFLKAVRNAKILMNDDLIGYPLENYLYQLPEEKSKSVISELLDMLTKEKKEIHEYDNFRDFLIGNFGENLYNLYFGPYNSKIWNTDISKVPLEWLDGKLPMPEIKEVILSNIYKKEESTMVHATFFYPKRDGSQFIVNRLAEGLNIRTSYQVSEINWVDGKLVINNSLDADILIYCGDVRMLSSIIKIEDVALHEALKRVVNLPSNGTSNVLCETDDNNLSWLYLPEDKFKAHRIIYTGNFSDSNNEGSTRKTCVVEFSGKQEEDLMLAELKGLPGNLKPLAFNFEPNSYIIQNKETRSDITSVKELLSKYNIHLLGRFAEWEYYNMDKCIEGAMQIREQIAIEN